MGGFGAPDRGGSREGKKSLRGNKQALQKLVKDEQKGHVKTAPRPTLSEKPPPALPPSSEGNAIVDSAAQLASRQFDRDQFKVLQRAASTGVGPIITYTTDDSKLEALVRTAKENAGQVYCMVGVHSDNIKRANDRLSPARLDQLKGLALEAGCVAVLAGLAFRDVGIRYAQERALSEQMELAAGVGLPLVLYEVRAAEALVERITEFRASGAGEGRAATIPIAIFNFGGSREELTAYLGLGCYMVLTGRVCDSTERGEHLRELAAAIPPDRLMLASDSPFSTPQNIPDVFVREGRNEPSNLPYVLEALASALGMPAAELAAATRRNTLTFFGIQEAAEAAAAAAAAAAVSATSTTPPPAVGAAAGVAAAAAATASGSQACGSLAAAAATSGAQPFDEEQQQQQQQAAPRSGSPQARRGKGKTKVAVDEVEDEVEDEDEGDRRHGVEEEENEGGDGDGAAESGRVRTAGCTASDGRRAAAREANRFALMHLGDDADGNEEEEEEEEEGTEDGSGDEGAGEHGGERAGSGAQASTTATGGEDARGRRGGGGGGGGSTDASRSKGPGRASLPPPRNFVAEYAAAAAAKGPVTGPRVSYSCRGCRSVLFTEEDTEVHRDEERALFAATKSRKKGRGRQANDSEAALCSMHFLRRPLAWMETCLQAEGPRQGEGKLVCPTCAAKLGKWAAGADAGGVQCSCGVVVPPPAYAVLKARLDIMDAQLDIASAVQSALKAYEEEGGDSGSSSSDEAPGTRKKRQKQKRNKTANFSSFRNKNFGFRLKEQRQIAETVSVAKGGDGAGRSGGGLDTVQEDGT